jgi:hypothetical protein
MLRVIAGKAEFGLQRHAVGYSSFQAFIDGIFGGLDEIIQELKSVIVSCVFDREYLLKYLEQTFVASVIGSGVQLEEILEGLQLYLQQIRAIKNILG